MSYFGTETEVDMMPDCDICAVDGNPGRPAYADARIPGSVWWNLCREHFDHYRCELGDGKGQVLVVGPAPV